MKVLILAPFAAAIISSIIWYEAEERMLTRAQKAGFEILCFGDSQVKFGVAPGYTDALKFIDGNPYGASLVADHDNIGEFDEGVRYLRKMLPMKLKILARREMAIAAVVFAGDMGKLPELARR